VPEVYETRKLISLFSQWDLAFPESFRDMFDVSHDHTTLTGPDIVFAPICWYATDGGNVGLRWNRDCEADLLDSM
jgi:hypothetical protein